MPNDCVTSPRRPGPGGTALRITDLTKTFEGRGRPVRAVDGLSMTARHGGVTALLGANGAGKTTTLQCAQGLLHPTAGTVRLLGEDPWRSGPAQRARVGVMLQDGGLPQAVRPAELLRHVSRLYREPRPVDELSRLLGIDSFEATPIRRLSGGQRQRVALAAALLGRPEVLFLDEPSAGLDPRSRQIVFDLISRLRAAGTCIILTTHLMDDAARLADYVYILNHGAVAAQGTVSELVSAERHAPTVMTVTLPESRTRQLREAPPWRGQGFAGIEWSVRDRTVTLTGALSASQIRELTAWATSNDSVPESLSVQPRSLEDVFLEISGRDPR